MLRCLQPAPCSKHVTILSRCAQCATHNHKPTRRSPYTTRHAAAKHTAATRTGSDDAAHTTPENLPGPTSEANISKTLESAIHGPAPSPAHTSHHDLPSFLAHARRTRLSRTSTVFNGTVYEYTAFHTLRSLGFDLQRIGGRNDAGIDLVGTWRLPSRDLPLKVLVQCKRLTGKNKISPNLIRELEGAFRGAPSGWRGEETIGLLVGPRSATKGVRDAMGRSMRALCWVMMDEAALEGEVEEEVAAERESLGTESVEAVITKSAGVGTVRQILWNQAAGTLGLEGITVVKRYADAGAGEGPVSAGTDTLDMGVGLMWRGSFVSPLNETVRHE